MKWKLKMVWNRYGEVLIEHNACNQIEWFVLFSFLGNSNQQLLQKVELAKVAQQDTFNKNPAGNLDMNG